MLKLLAVPDIKALFASFPYVRKIPDKIANYTKENWPRLYKVTNQILDSTFLKGLKKISLIMDSLFNSAVKQLVSLKVKVHYWRMKQELSPELQGKPFNYDSVQNDSYRDELEHDEQRTLNKLLKKGMSAKLQHIVKTRFNELPKAERAEFLRPYLEDPTLKPRGSNLANELKLVDEDLHDVNLCKHLRNITPKSKEAKKVAVFLKLLHKSKQKYPTKHLLEELNEQVKNLPDAQLHLMDSLLNGQLRPNGSQLDLELCEQLEARLSAKKNKRTFEEKELADQILPALILINHATTQGGIRLKTFHHLKLRLGSFSAGMSSQRKETKLSDDTEGKPYKDAHLSFFRNVSAFTKQLDELNDIFLETSHADLFGRDLNLLIEEKMAQLFTTQGRFWDQKYTALKDLRSLLCEINNSQLSLAHQASQSTMSLTDLEGSQHLSTSLRAREEKLLSGFETQLTEIKDRDFSTGYSFFSGGSETDTLFKYAAVYLEKLRHERHNQSQYENQAASAKASDSSSESESHSSGSTLSTPEHAMSNLNFLQDISSCLFTSAPITPLRNNNGYHAKAQFASKQGCEASSDSAEQEPCVEVVESREDGRATRITGELAKCEREDMKNNLSKLKFILPETTATSHTPPKCKTSKI